MHVERMNLSVLRPDIGIIELQKCAKTKPIMCVYLMK